MFGAIIGPVLGGIAGSLIGGLFGKEGAEDQASAVRESNVINAQTAREINAQNIKFQREANRRNIALQREFAQMGVRWRVADAKQAGLHPLYALGASGATFSPSVQAPRVASWGHQPEVGSNWQGAMGANLGQDIGRAISAAFDPYQRAMQDANLRAMEASTAKDFAQAQYWASRASTFEQGSAASSPFPSEGPGVGYTGPQVLEMLQRYPGSDYHPNNLGLTDMYKYKPSEPLSRRSDDPSLEARAHPMWREYNMSQDFNLILPWSDEGPFADAHYPVWLWPAIVKKNVDTYGTSWLKRALGELPFLGEVLGATQWRFTTNAPERR